MPYPIPSHIRRWWARVEALAARPGAIHAWQHGPASFASSQAGVLEEFHPEASVEFCLAGAIRIEKPDVRVDLQPGDALLIAPGVWHRMAPLRAGAVRLELGFMPSHARVYFQSAEDTWCGRLANEPCRALTGAALAGDAQQRRAAVARILDAIIQAPIEHLLFDSLAQWRMVHLLWTRTRSGLTVEEMLAASGLSRTHAYRQFLAGYGLTPKRAIESTRVRLAEQLLATGAPVAEVAAQCGFPSADTFRRAWRRHHGGPPRRQPAPPGQDPAGGRRRRRG